MDNKPQKQIFIFLLQIGAIISLKAQSSAYILQAGSFRLHAIEMSENQYRLAFYLLDKPLHTLDPLNPVYLEVGGTSYMSRYRTISIQNNVMICEAFITTNAGTQFLVTDRYSSHGENQIELQRRVEIVKAVLKDSHFNSLFGFQITTAGSINEHEYFIPGVWYKGNFDPEVHLPSIVPQNDDTDFHYREDRITLPLVMSRHRIDGTTITIIHKDANPQTVMADNQQALKSADYQFGALGVKRRDNATYQSFVFPGSEAERRSGKGYRHHPIRLGVAHEYNLLLIANNTDNYAVALKEAWNTAFDLYNPTVYPVNLSACYDGLIETLLQYYVPSEAQGGSYNAPGFPFEIALSDFQARGINYNMGFVGMQLPSGYYLFRHGVENNQRTARENGEAVLNFWANNSLTSLGFPRTWYDPGINKVGSFRPGSDLRTAVGGMEGLLSAWCFAKKHQISRSYWLQACTRFGNWLLENQNSDGSFYFSYNHQSIINGKHPVSDTNKHLTICVLRYLVELYIATGNEAYKNSAIRGGEFCLANIHEKYHYLACVVDNPHSYDSESGQMALNGFLALYGLTDDIKWLNAAEQSAVYAETWVYAYEIPVEKDRTTPTSFPRDRSIVGQHLIGISHAAADLGFTWSSFAFYYLYLITGNEHYLHVSRIAAHNTKQSLNWDQSIYPGQAKGLQLEAFPVTIPRRSNGVEMTLNWNYAAHLDPMFRFKDAFDTYDLEQVYLLPKEEQIRRIRNYAKIQSSNYGQSVSSGATPAVDTALMLHPNPVKKHEKVFIDIPTNNQFNTIKIYNIQGEVLTSIIGISTSRRVQIDTHNLAPGAYLVALSGKQMCLTSKLLIQ